MVFVGFCRSEPVDARVVVECFDDCATQIQRLLDDSFSRFRNTPEFVQLMGRESDEFL